MTCRRSTYQGCEGQKGLFSGVIRDYDPHDGVRINLTNLDCTEIEGRGRTVDMDSWGFDSLEFYRKHGQGACVTVLVEIEGENSVYPDVGFEALVGVEGEQERLLRVAAEKQSQKEEESRRIAEAKIAKESMKKKYGCVPTIIVTYRCEGSSRNRDIREQHFCFNLNRDSARERVEAMCKDRHFKGAGAVIQSVNATGYTY